MKINGIDLKEKYGDKIRIGQQTIREREVINYTDWLDTAIIPVEGKKPKCKFFDIEMEFIVIGETKTEAEKNASSIISELSQGKLELDNMNLMFEGELKEYSKEFLKRWSYELIVKWKAWGKNEKEEIISFSSESKKIIVPGNLETPCIIELIPTGDILTYLLKACARDPVTGEPEDILIKNLRQGKKVVIDGENCTVTEDGKNKFADTEMWEFPSLVLGENTLTFVSSSVPCEVTIKYKPRYI